MALIIRIAAALLLFTSSAFAQAPTSTTLAHNISTSATVPLPFGSCMYVDQGPGTDVKLCPSVLQGWAQALNAQPANYVAVATNPGMAPPVTLNNPANYVGISSGGSMVPYCQAEAVPFGCQSPFQNDFTAQIAAIMTTYGAAEIQENSLNIVVYDTSGQVNWWLASTGWSANARVLSETNGKIYAQGSSACVSGSTAPTGSGGSDGTCTWTLVGGSDQAAKQGIGVSILAGPNGGDAWAIAAETDFQAGFTGNGGFGMELDTRNASSIDPVPGNAGMHTMDALYFGGIAGANPITNFIDVAGQQNPVGPVFAAYNGIRLLGINSFKSFGILFETTGGLIGIGNEPLLSAQNFSLAFVSDSGLQPIAWDEGGTCTIACFYFNATAPADIQFAGVGNANVGLFVTGTFPNSFVSSVGGKTAGWDEAGTCSVSCFYITPTSAPSGIQFAGAGMNVGINTTATFGTAVWSDTATAGTSLITAAGTYPTALLFAMAATTPNIIMSTNFSLSGVGKVTAASYAAGASNGLSCSGAPSGSFATVNGIVTHC